MYSDREVHTDPLSGTYSLESDDANEGEELKILAV